MSDKLSFKNLKKGYDHVEFKSSDSLTSLEKCLRGSEKENFSIKVKVIYKYLSKTKKEKKDLLNLVLQDELGLQVKGTIWEKAAISNYSKIEEGKIYQFHGCRKKEKLSQNLANFKIKNIK